MDKNYLINSPIIEGETVMQQASSVVYVAGAYVQGER